MKIKQVNILIETEREFDKKVLKDLEKIDKGIFPKKLKTNISFESIEDFRKFLTPNRIELLSFIRIKKPSSIYQVAKDLHRDRKNVSKDIKLLSDLGFVELKEEHKKRDHIRPIVAFDRVNLGIDLIKTPLLSRV